MNRSITYVILSILFLSCTENKLEGFWYSYSIGPISNTSEVYFINGDSLQVKVNDSNNYWRFAEQFSFKKSSKKEFEHDSLGFNLRFSRKEIYHVTNDSIVYTKPLKRIDQFIPDVSIDDARKFIEGKSISYRILDDKYHYDIIKENRMIVMGDTLKIHSFDYNHLFQLGTDIFFVPYPYISQVIQIKTMDESKITGKIFWGDIEEEIEIPLKSLPNSLSSTEGRWKSVNEDEEMYFNFIGNMLIRTTEEKIDTFNIQPLSDQKHFVVLSKKNNDYISQIQKRDESNIEIVILSRPYQKDKKLTLTKEY